MIIANYSLRSQENLLSHFSTQSSYVRDLESIDDGSRELMMNARVRSGDYLMTVATELDKIGQGLAIAQSPHAADIERLVAELLYVNRHYLISKKHP